MVYGTLTPSLHPLVFAQNLTRSMRRAIEAGELPDYVRGFLTKMFPNKDVPHWVVNAMGAASISLPGVATLKPEPYVPPPTYAELVARGEIQERPA